MSIADLKDQLRDVPGIEGLTMTNMGSRTIFTWNGLLVGVDPLATQDEIETKIREAAATRIMTAPPLQSQWSPQVSITGYEPGTIKAKLEEIKAKAAERRSAALSKLDAANSKAASVDAELEKIAAMIDKEADDAMQEFATTTNGGPA